MSEEIFTLADQVTPLKKIAICIKCEHCLKRDVSNINYYCKKEFKIDFVTGEKIYYTECRHSNKDGNCQHFEIKKPRPKWYKRWMMKYSPWATTS